MGLTFGRFGVADDAGALERGAVVHVDVWTIVQTRFGAGAVDIVEGENARHGSVG